MKRAPARKKARSSTPTWLARRGGKSKNGKSPSGFTLAGYVTPEEYADRAHRPKFLNVLPADEDPCHTCTSECCRARVVLNVADLARLVVPLRLPASSICDLTECDSRNGEPILIGDTPKHIVLRKSDDDFCSLLLTVDGRRRCGVHAIRPGICRIYPFSFDRGRIRYEIGYVACPTQWLVSKPRQDEILDDVERHEQDRALDRRVVRKWNRRPAEERTVSAFWGFAVQEVGRALRMDVSSFFRVPPRTQLKPPLW